MTFVTAGHTTHFTISYDDALPQSAGLDRAQDLLNYCESDLALMQSWFLGVNFQFAFPISVQITGDSGGGGWTDPPDFALWFGFHPSIDLKPGAGPTTELLRYILVAEITEMFMASQRKKWFGDTHWAGADEGSMGESLSRFLASEFLATTGIAKAIFSGFNVANFFLNDFLRPNFVDISLDDVDPNNITGCGTCFIFFLKYHLGFSIQQIIAASADTLGGVYTNLTGKTDGWQTFKNLLDLHYPHTIGGTSYFPPLDNVFPVADLQSLTAPPELSWAFNSTPNVAWLSLNHSLPVNVDIMLSSDDPAMIGVPASVSLNSSLTVMLAVPQQSAAFISEVVTLTANYAGKQITAAINIVRPEALPVAALQIVPTSNDNPCSQHLVEATAQGFVVKNPNVIIDQTGLSYNWTVIGANAAITDEPTLTIASLPAAGTDVTIKVSLSNAAGIHAEGKYEFTTVERQTGFREQIRQLDCSLRQLRAINAQIMPWIPVERGEILIDAEQLARIENQSKSVALAAQQVLAAAKATRSTMMVKERRLKTA